MTGYKPTDAFCEALMVEIRAMETAQIDAKRAPVLVTYAELSTCVKTALNELYKAGKIKVGDTLNDKYIKTVKQ